MVIANSFECCFCPKRWCKSFVHTGHVTPLQRGGGGAAGTFPSQGRRPRHAELHSPVSCSENRLGYEHKQSNLKSYSSPLYLTVSQRLSYFLAQQWCYLLYISLNVLSEALLMWFAEILCFFQISVHSVLPWLWNLVLKRIHKVKGFFLYFCFFNSHDCILKWNCQNIVK